MWAPISTRWWCIGRWWVFVRNGNRRDLTVSEEGKGLVGAAIRRLAIVSILETFSFLVLLVMMVRHNEAGVSIVGMTHGILFLAFALLVVKDRESFGWTWLFVAVAILTGPIGAILVLERLPRRDARTDQ